MGRATKKELSLGRNQIQKDETMTQGTLLPLVEPPQVASFLVWELPLSSSHTVSAFRIGPV